jgi:hypothetical protein
MQTKGKNFSFKGHYDSYEIYKTKCPELNDLVKNLLNSFEIPHDYIPPSTNTWTGNKLHLGQLGGGAIGILHEICHWQVASSEHRFKTEYGLGYYSHADADKDRSAPDIDEIAACFLSFCWLASWGVSPVGHMADTNLLWTPDPSPELYEHAYVILTSSGLISSDFTPGMVARIRERRRR